MASENKVVAALGRPFTLGMVYDARKDELIPGFTLWDEQTLKENTVVTSQHMSTFEITASDSTDEKSFLLDVEASLKISILGGLIEAGGSAKYLNNQKKFHNQSRVTLQYNATTNFKQLRTNLGTKKMQPTEALEKGLATHVVTGILYGANAFFVFDSEKLDASKVQDIQGRMEAVIKKIPFVDIEGSASLKLTDEEKKLTEMFSCKFYGDFILEKNPASFTDAVKTYAELPKLLGEEGKDAVPMKVWLMPLENLDFSPAQKTEFLSKIPQVRGISIGLMRKADNVLDDLNQFVMRCNDALQEDVVKHILQMHDMMSSFQKLVKYYISALKHMMAEKLPLIREEKEDERSLIKVFEDRESSPFSHDKLSKWMENKEREITVMRSCVEMLEGAKIVPDQSELDREVLTPGVDHALCFIFTSVESADPYLHQLAEYVDQFKLDQGLHIKEVSVSKQWYWSDKVLTEMREKARDFHDIVKPLKKSSRVCFLVAAIANEKYQGATIYHYKRGLLLSENFSKPDITDVENVTDRTDFIWYACDLSLDPNTANYSLTLSDDHKKVTTGETQSYPDLPERFAKVPQVLCREGLTGHHYWEVEWSDRYSDWLGLGAAYKRISRKGEEAVAALGFNAFSWYFGHWALPNNESDYSTALTTWYDNKRSTPSAVSATGWNRVGVYLDWQAGTLSFYQVLSNKLTHIHTFRNKFTEPVYPAFWIRNPDNYMALCPVD
ncbi:neoverrucotoxin subunit alpha-like [Pelmatolapia mariae]|uniref:neoverrucotoxin subunit alpha-like n=1 Tax=Pelmatolapia mariae TaxID=158779 RepID=UPI002FE55941